MKFQNLNASFCKIIPLLKIPPKKAVLPSTHKKATASIASNSSGGGPYISGHQTPKTSINNSLPVKKIDA